MKDVQTLYKQLYTEHRYVGLDEVKILTSLYSYTTCPMDWVIAQIINEAVINHMSVKIDSTLMQIMALSEYLSQLFINNFHNLVHNYILHYLEQRSVRELNDYQMEKIQRLSRQVHKGTALEELIDVIQYTVE